MVHYWVWSYTKIIFREDCWPSDQSTINLLNPIIGICKSVGIESQSWWAFQNILMDLQSFWESRVMTVSFCWFVLSARWCGGSTSVWNILSPFGPEVPPSCVNLSKTYVEHLGRITISSISNIISVRNEFTFSCSFLARLCVSDP